MLETTGSEHVKTGFIKQANNEESSESALFEQAIYGTKGWLRQRAGDLAPLGGCAGAFEESLHT